MHHISYWIKNYALFSKPIRSKTNSNRELLVNVFNSFQPQPLSLTGNWFISLSTRTVIGYAINFLRCSIFRPRLSDYIHTVAHKCNGETKSHGKTNFNSRHNKINLQSNETSRQNKTNSRQNNINWRQNKISSRQNKINSRQNKINSRQNNINSRQNEISSRKIRLTHGKIKSVHGKIQSTHGKIKINSRQNTH